MQVTNPHWSIKDEENNIFTIRKKDYEKLLPTITRMLDPVLACGFKLEELSIKDAKIISNELMQTYYDRLIMKFTRNEEKVIDLTMRIPKMIDDNKIYIGGRIKIPMFQVNDIPIVIRSDKTVKIKTSCTEIFINTESPSSKYSYTISFMGKKIPLSTLFLAYLGPETVEKMFVVGDCEIEDRTEEDCEECKRSNDCLLMNENIKPLSEEFKKILEDGSENKEHYLKKLGKYYTKYNPTDVGNQMVKLLDLAYDIDVNAKDILQAETMVGVILETLINKDKYNDLNYRNKRIRVFDYLILGEVAKSLFNMCRLSLKGGKKFKFNVNTKSIMNECNTSDIVQFDFSINPIQELTLLSRTTMVGPGGFKKDKVPRHLRDIHDSMFGRICPIDTPDRDNCGVQHNLLPNTKLDSVLRFSEEIDEKCTTSIPVSMVPFLEHDDQTRLQMASSQMRQAIMLQTFEKPLIKSGIEDEYTKYTSFLKVARKDGVVAHSDRKLIIVLYDDGDKDVFNVTYRKIFMDNMDVMKIYVRAGDKVKKGDILAESQFVDNGTIQYGKNLLTGVMAYYGYNYEDGIVISDRLVKEETLHSAHYIDLSFEVPETAVLLSLDTRKYNPLPNTDKNPIHLSRGFPYAKVKEMSADITGVETLFNKPIEYNVDRPTVITDVTVYPNKLNKDFKQYSDWIMERYQSQIDKDRALVENLKSFMTEDEAIKLLKKNRLIKFIGKPGNFKYKGNKFDLRVEIYGLYFRPIQIGDKLGNRHGNKGVVSRIVPTDKMPSIVGGPLDGKKFDILVNPMGIISRMNIGQLFELHLALTVKILKEKLNKLIEDGKKQKELKDFILEYISLIDNTENNWLYKESKRYLRSRKIDREFVEDFSIVQPPFESATIDMIREAMKFTGTDFKYNVYDPFAKSKYENKIVAGYMYFFRLMHIAEEKLAARGIGPYTKRTLQPKAGRKFRGGQRLGEMEVHCLAAMGGEKNLKECLTVKSDSIDLKDDYIHKTISDSYEEPGELDTKCESTKLLENYLLATTIKRGENEKELRSGDK